jgi:hypothetical protein
VVYEWTSADATPWSAIPVGYNRKTLLVPGPIRGAIDGQVNTIKLRAYISGNAGAASEATVQLKALGAPLAARLRGPTGDFKSTATMCVCVLWMQHVDAGGWGCCLFYVFDQVLLLSNSTEGGLCQFKQ